MLSRFSSNRRRRCGSALLVALLTSATVVLAAACSSSGSAGGGSRSSATAGPVPDEAGSVNPSAAPDAAGDARSPADDVTGSGGTGGLGCTRSEDLGDGRTICVAKIGSVELKLVQGSAGPSPAPFRLGVYLHGDGAAAYKGNGALQAMLAWADARHGLAVAALAPNGCAWWLRPEHDCAGTQTDADLDGRNAAALATALDAILKAFDVRTDGLRYYGSSGGSIFLTNAWIPLQAGRYPGVFAIMCGGETSSRMYTWDTSDAALRAKSPLWFTYGDRDYLLPDIKASIADFEGKSFAVTEKVVPNAGHCEFDAHAEAIGIWTANP